MALKTFSEVNDPQKMGAYLRKMLGGNYGVFAKKFKNLKINQLQDFANALFEDWLIQRNINLHKIDFANFAFGSAGFRAVVEEISKNDNSFFVKSFVFKKTPQKEIQPLPEEILSLILKYKKNINLFAKFEQVFSSSELSKKYPDAFDDIKYEIQEHVSNALRSGESLKRGSDSFREYLGQSFNKMMKGLHFNSKIENHKAALASQEKYKSSFDENFSKNFYPEYYNEDSSALRPFSGKDFEDGQDFRKKLNALLKYPKNIKLLDEFIKKLQKPKSPCAPQDLEKFYVKLANDIFCAKHDESLPKTKRKSLEFREYLGNEFRLFQEFLKQKDVLNIENNNKLHHGKNGELAEIDEESEPDEKLQLKDDGSSSSDLDSVYSKEDFDLVNDMILKRATEALPPLNYSPPRIVEGNLTGNTRATIRSPLFNLPSENQGDENNKANPLPSDKPELSGAKLDQTPSPPPSPEPSVEINTDAEQNETHEKNESDTESLPNKDDSLQETFAEETENQTPSPPPSTDLSVENKPDAEQNEAGKENKPDKEFSLTKEDDNPTATKAEETKDHTPSPPPSPSVENKPDDKPNEAGEENNNPSFSKLVEGKGKNNPMLF